MPKINFKKIIIIEIILLPILLFFFYCQQKHIKPLNIPLTKTNRKLPSPTPFAFKKLTIPYLKNRKYQSSLGELNQINKTQTHTSYLTSYNSDGLTINGLLTVPNIDPPENGFPAVIFVHGYIPPSNYQTLQDYQRYIIPLAENDIIVFKIDLRGHAESQGQASGAYFSGDYIIDALNAYSALQNSDFVNSQKIGLWGHSMAGNIVFRALAAKPDIPKIVIWAGAVYTYEDFSQFRIQDNSYQPPPQESQRRQKRNELFETYGRFDPNSDFWKQVPATNYLNDVNGEIQIHHALNDDVVNIGYSQNLAEILNNANIPHQLFEYQTGGHNITGTAFDQAILHTIDFFKN